MSIIHIEPSVVNRTYGVQIVFDQALRIHFEIELGRIKAAQNGHFLFSLDKKQVYINNQVPELIADKLAEDLGKVIYPLVLQVNEEGYIHFVANAEEIKNRWEKERPLIERYYQGEIVAEALSYMDELAGDAQMLTAMLKKDWFLALFFSGIYGLGPFDFRQHTDIKLPMEPFAPMLNYKITREITEQHTQNKSLIIACKGKLAEAIASLAENKILETDKEPEGALNLEYRLYHNDFSVRGITGQSTWTPPGAKGRQVDFEIFHLPGKDKALTATQGGDG